MPSTGQLLDQLNEARLDFSRAGGARVERLLVALYRARFTDAESLVRFHEILLFLSAYPQSPGVLRRVEQLLSSFSRRVRELAASNADMETFDFMEYSGIAGTVITGTFSYDVARWLVERFPRSVSIDWQDYEHEDRLGQTLAMFLPLLDEEGLVEANIPFRQWLAAAVGRRQGEELSWLLSRIDEIEGTEKEKAALYDGLGLFLRWELVDSRATRTHSLRRVRKVFYHDRPLIRRNEVSLADEINATPLSLKKLSRAEGLKAMDMLREAVTVRYRELYGITHGDPRRVVHARPGRGVEIFLWGLPPERRLPLRAYLAGFTLKNGVPINYIEGISLFERMELGFNMFYTYRDGESAWVYAQVLRLLHQVSGVTAVSVDPYQIGFNNEEAIESGAFWFYRKLGFRPTWPELERLTTAEEKSMARIKGRRSSARTLRRLSEGNIVYELPGSPSGYWDKFRIRNLGLAVNRRMAREFKSDPARMARDAESLVRRALNINLDDLTEQERRAFHDWALVLALVPDLGRWTDDEKRAIERTVRAKAGADEMLYLRLLQRHARLRDAVRKLGSRKQ